MRVPSELSLPTYITGLDSIPAFLLHCKDTNLYCLVKTSLTSHCSKALFDVEKAVFALLLLSHGGNYQSSRGYFLFPPEERKNSSDLSFDSSEVSSDSSEVLFDSSEEIPKFFAGNFQIPPKRFWLPRKGVRCRIFHSKMQFGVELALLRTPPPLLGGREEQVASCRDEKRDDALTVPLRLMQYICC